MIDQIDGPMLMGIAAILSSLVNIATTIQSRRRPPPARPRRRRPGPAPGRDAARPAGARKKTGVRT